jgi:phospholipid-binding lipoprotein MlaA
MRRSAVICTAALAGLLFPLAAIGADGDKPASTDAAQVQAQEEKDKDPLEGLNRFTFGLNTVLRKTIINPLVDVYQAVTPDPLEKAISNATTNLTEPVTAASSLLQGDTEHAGVATKRFLVNTTAGLGGTRDVAGEEMGLEHRKEDLGQAAGAGGMDTGPYLVLPIIGPSSTRDAIGDVAVSLAVPPAGLANAADSATKYSENQDELDGMTKGAIDPYIVEREAYLQNRRAQILNGQITTEEIPDFEEDDVK